MTGEVVSAAPKLTFKSSGSAYGSDCGTAKQAPATPVPGNSEVKTSETKVIDLTKADALEASAKAAWEAYSKVIGGKAQTWAVMAIDPKKKQFVKGWRAAANAAVTAFFASTSK